MFTLEKAMPNSNIVRLHSFSYTALAVTIFLLSCFISTLAEANNSSFTIDLIHRDSPKSPFYNHSQTSYERMNNAFLRSFHRANYLASGLIPSGGEYLLEIYYGSQSFRTIAIADTGSDLTWIQCQPCMRCFDQKDPIFIPKNSSTFKLARCRSRTICPYNIEYEDGSHSQGVLANENIRIGSSASSNFLFGCGHDNVDPGRTFCGGTGVVGLGFGDSSLVTQLNPSIQGNFSYCLGPNFNRLSKLHLGTNPLISGRGVVSTPLIMNRNYLLILEGISVGNRRLQFPNNPNTTAEPGNIIIDSGTTISTLPTSLHQEFESIVKNGIRSNRTVRDRLGHLSLCYPSLNRLRTPTITLHFRGADLVLKPFNAFVVTSPYSTCLAFRPTTGIPIFGNMAQTNFWVGHDLRRGIVSFKPADCNQP